MDRLSSDRDLVERIINEYAALPVTYGEIDRELIFDRTRDRYVLMLVGRLNGRRMYGPSIHVDLIDGKFWIQCDGTEEGVATDLLEAGIPKDRIVLGFKSPEMRKLTDFAVA